MKVETNGNIIVTVQKICKTLAWIVGNLPFVIELKC